MVDGDLRMVSLNGFDVKSMTYGGLACVSLDLARFRANGPTGISMWAVQLSLQRIRKSPFPVRVVVSISFLIFLQIKQTR